MGRAGSTTGLLRLHQWRQVLKDEGGNQTTLMPWQNGDSHVPPNLSI